MQEQTAQGGFYSVAETHPCRERAQVLNKALGLVPGHEIILPTFTMIVTANAARYIGATIKLVDAGDPDLVAAAITPRTKGIIVVRTYGHPTAMDRLREIATVHKIFLIEDGAEAHGAFDKRRVGGLGTAGTLSFYANKIVTTGEGGMVTTNDPELYKLARRLRHHAFSPERHFWHEYVAFNYRMTNLQAAIELAQAERLQATVAARRGLRTRYDEGLRLPRRDRVISL